MFPRRRCHGPGSFLSQLLVMLFVQRNLTIGARQRSSARPVVLGCSLDRGSSRLSFAKYSRYSLYTYHSQTRSVIAPMKNHAFGSRNALHASSSTEMDPQSGVVSHPYTLPLETFATTTENTLLMYLTPEKEVIDSSATPPITRPRPAETGDKIKPRQVKNCHYTPVIPEKLSQSSSGDVTKPPYLVAASRDCAETALGLDPAEFSRPEFIQAFSGNQLLPGLNEPYCTVYGCHCYGQWFGQLGDGRAVSIGEVYNPVNTSPASVDSAAKTQPTVPTDPAVPGTDNEQNMIRSRERVRYELQLKGGGRSPYSRGFDGKAVLRSCVREYLVSEAMHHLRVPTTRALSIIGTGEEVRRPWYAASSQENTYKNSDNITTKPSSSSSGKDGGYGEVTKSTKLPRKRKLAPRFSPDYLLREPGAVMCRVSTSFLRFGQMELFGMRDEMEELQTLADYVCFREYPHLLSIVSSPSPAGLVSSTTDAPNGIGAVGGNSRLLPGPPERYVQLYREVAQRAAYLVAEWMRVGYVQGNMNSDNTLLGGRTLDYGPYGWMEKFDPFYQPFTSDQDLKFSYIRQPNAMSINVAVLGETAFTKLVKHATRREFDLRRKNAGNEGKGTASESKRALEKSEDGNNSETKETIKVKEGFSESLSESMSEKAMLAETQQHLAELKRIATEEFGARFFEEYNKVRAQKLGFVEFSGESDENLWSELLTLMHKSEADFTIFFRELGNAADFSAAAGEDISTAAEEAFEAVRYAFYTEADDAAATDINDDNAGTGMSEESMVSAQADAAVSEFEDEWVAWFEKYLSRIKKEGRDSAERKREQNLANPKFVLRNWMSVLAYERAEKHQDYSVIEELTDLLMDPYDLQHTHTNDTSALCGTEEKNQNTKKWYRKTPNWARDMPGVAFMS